MIFSYISTRSSVVRLPKPSTPPGLAAQVVGEGELSFQGGRVFRALRVLFDQRLVRLKRLVRFSSRSSKLGGAKPGGGCRFGEGKIVGQFVVGLGGGGSASLASRRGDLSEAGGGLAFLVCELGGTGRRLAPSFLPKPNNFGSGIGGGMRTGGQSHTATPTGLDRRTFMTDSETRGGRQLSKAIGSRGKTRETAWRLRSEIGRHASAMMIWLKAGWLLVVAGMLVARPRALAEEDKWVGEVTALEARLAGSAPAPGGVVFAGSSTIRLWDVASAFPGLRPLNAGFGGSRFADCHRFAPRLVHAWKPATVVLYCGNNDLAGGLSPDEVVRDFMGFASELHAALPDCRLVVLSILPTPSRWKLWPQARRRMPACARCARLSGSRDCGSSMWRPRCWATMDSRKQSYFVDDRLHLNAGGYEVLKSKVAPLLPAGK